MGQVIVFCSGKGGTGKTSMCALIAMGLAQRGKRVLVIDACPGMRCMDIVFGAEAQAIYSWADVMEERCSYSDAVIHAKVDILGAPWNRNDTDAAGMKDITNHFRSEYDHILIDAAPGLELSALFGAADSAIVVIEPDMMSVRIADKVCAAARRTLRDINLLVNRYDHRAVTEGAAVSIDVIEELIAYPLTGIVPQTRQIKNMIRLRQLSGKAGDIIKLIAGRIDGEVTQLTPVGKLAGFKDR